VNRNRQGQEDHIRQVALVQWSHKADQKEYVSWFLDGLGSMAGSINKTNIMSGYGTSMKKAWSKSGYAIYQSFYNVDTHFPSSVDRLSTLGLAVFFMDDGSLTHTDKQRDRTTFSCCDYTEDQCDFLIDVFSNMGLTATKHFYDYWYLTLNADNTNKMAEMIASYVPPIMQYKLPEQYRGRYVAFTEDDPTTSAYYVRRMKVIGVDNKVPRNQRIKYDLETETHNFFANGVLVHNCTSMYRDYMHARSLEEEHHESRCWVKNLHGKISYDIPEGFRICGENVYALHSIPYMELPSYFLVFSIWDQNNICLSWDDTVEYAAVLGLQTVPVIWRGIWNEEFIRSLAPVDTNKHEGYTERVASSFPYGAFRKSIAKWVRPHHVQTTHGWKTRAVVKNGLRST
jgi:hypothetical protein